MTAMTTTIRTKGTQSDRGNAAAGKSLPERRPACEPNSGRARSCVASRRSITLIG
jgi:hypothetical protein